jgi:SAM-dependent methyltransferase
MTNIDWNRLSAYRNEVPRNPLKLPLVFSTLYKQILQNIPKNAEVLDIGANDRTLLKQLNGAGFSGKYKSMDISKDTMHDYRSIDEINDHFDVVVMKEVIEHLPLGVCIDYIRRIREILKPGGRLILTTPNVFSVVHWEAWDITHVQHYPYHDLYSILRSQGFQVDLKRIAEPILNRKLPLNLLKLLYQLIHVHCFRPTDFAGSLFAVARPVTP